MGDREKVSGLAIFLLASIPHFSMIGLLFNTEDEGRTFS
jgi:hypothetical protein